MHNKSNNLVLTEVGISPALSSVMCIFKACPLYATCEKEVEQVVYCRHVEMIKKIGKLRLEMRKKVEAVSVGNAIATPEQSHSELKALSDRPALGEIN